MRLLDLFEARVFHGSQQDQPRFAFSHTGTNSMVFGSYETTRTGVFFTDNPEFAAMYGKVREYDVSPRRVLNLDQDYPRILGDFMDSIGPHDEHRDVYLDTREILRGTWPLWQMFENERGGLFVSYLMAMGYDAATFSEVNEDDDGEEQVSNTLVVFDPKVIQRVVNETADSVPPETMAKTIREITKQYVRTGTRLEEIGSGLCYEFASDVMKSLAAQGYAVDYLRGGGAGVRDIQTDDFWVDDFLADLDAIQQAGARVPPNLPRDQLASLIGGATHAWLLLGGKHYDAEAPEGVDDFLDLPFFARQIDGLRNELQGLTELATDEPGFREWFGRSKVVDAQGRPEPQFHGTFRDFAEFRPFSHFGSADAANERIRDKEAEHRRMVDPPEDADPRVVPVFLKIENPIEVRDWGGLTDWWDFMGPCLMQNIISEDEYVRSHNREDFIDLIRSKGYDGFTYINAIEHKGSRSWVPLDNDQIWMVHGKRPLKEKASILENKGRPLAPLAYRRAASGLSEVEKYNWLKFLYYWFSGSYVAKRNRDKLAMWSELTKLFPKPKFGDMRLFRVVTIPSSMVSETPMLIRPSPSVVSSWSSTPQGIMGYLDVAREQTKDHRRAYTSRVMLESKIREHDILASPNSIQSMVLALSEDWYSKYYDEDKDRVKPDWPGDDDLFEIHDVLYLVDQLLEPGGWHGQHEYVVRTPGKVPTRIVKVFRHGTRRFDGGSDVSTALRKSSGRKSIVAFESVNAYPKVTDPEGVADLVQQIHHRDEDIWDGDLMERIYAFSVYELVEVPTGSIRAGQWNVDEDRVAQYVERLNAGEQMPPLVVQELGMVMIDGTHRHAAAVQAGLETVPVYLGRAIYAVSDEENPYASGDDLEESMKEPVIDAHRQGPVMWIDMFYVPENMRGRGIGRKYYQQWESRLPKDVKYIRLVPADIGDGVGASDGFWEAMGFDYLYFVPGTEKAAGVPDDMVKGVNGNPTPRVRWEAN